MISDFFWDCTIYQMNSYDIILYGSIALNSDHVYIYIMQMDHIFYIQIDMIHTYSVCICVYILYNYRFIYIWLWINTYKKHLRE